MFAQVFRCVWASRMLCDQLAQVDIKKRLVLWSGWVLQNRTIGCRLYSETFIHAFASTSISTSHYFYFIQQQSVCMPLADLLHWPSRLSGRAAIGSRACRNQSGGGAAAAAYQCVATPSWTLNLNSQASVWTIKSTCERSPEGQGLYCAKKITFTKTHTIHICR